MNGPASEKVVNALSFDVEDYFHATALANAFRGESWETLPSRVETNTRRLLDLLDRANTKATFFVLGWVAERFGGLVREINYRGHEIGSHGYSHSLIYTQTEKDFRAETRKGKATLEQLIGVRVRGYRAASFSIVRKSLWALDVLGEEGFEYDSSIFPVLHDRYGMLGAPRFPHYLRLSSGATLIEVPPSTLRFAGMTLPTGGGGYFRLLPYSYTEFSLRRLNFVERQPMVFYLHPWDMDEQQPRGDVSLVTKARHYFNVARCEHRLAKLLSRWSFAPITTVLGRLGNGLPVHQHKSYV